MVTIGHFLDNIYLWNFQVNPACSIKDILDQIYIYMNGNFDVHSSASQ